MRLAIDGFISWRDELDLWRAGHQVPVRAEEAEEDVCWLVRAKSDHCDVVITEDVGAARTAYNMGFHVVLFENQLKVKKRSTEILYQLRQLEEPEMRATG